MSSKTESVLDFGSEFGVGGGKMESSLRVLLPSLVEDHEEVIPRLDNPPEAALPAQPALAIL